MPSRLPVTRTPWWSGPPPGAAMSSGSLLADLDVHPHVAMRILRHAQFSITMEVYTEISPQATREALKRLGESLG